MKIERMNRQDEFLVYITLPANCDAVALAENMVERGLCAGVNIMGPGKSVYYWQESMHKADEWIIFAQVAASRLEAFEKELLNLHPHEVPCMVALRIDAGHAPFLDWILSPQGVGFSG